MKLVFHVMYHQHCVPLSDLYIVQIPPSTHIEAAADTVRSKLKQNSNVYEVILIGECTGGIQVEMWDSLVA